MLQPEVLRKKREVDIGFVLASCALRPGKVAVAISATSNMNFGELTLAFRWVANIERELRIL